MYDDGEVGMEDLQQKKHKLPDLTGDKVLNPDADALSSSDSDEDGLPAGICYFSFHFASLYSLIMHHGNL